MAFYESIYIIRPDLPNEQREAVIQVVAELVERNGGKILYSEDWGRRELAYPVKKTTRGQYLFNVLEGGGALVANLEARLAIHEDVLKYINVCVKKPVLGPSAMAAPPSISLERDRGEDRPVVDATMGVARTGEEEEV